MNLRRPSSAQQISTPSEALCRSIWNDDLAGLRGAVQAGALLSDVRTRTGEASTVLIEAAKRGVPLVAYLLQQGFDPNEADTQGFAPLHHAQQPSVIGLLLDAHANPLARTLRGITPLHCCGEPEGCELLLQAGADPWARTDSGSLPWQSLRQDARRWGRASQHEPAVRLVMQAADLIQAAANKALLSSQTLPATLLVHRRKRSL